MEELIESIQELGSRDSIDIIAIFSPIFLSLVAIAISIYTVHKQNKIALFDKRFSLVTKIRLLFTLSNCTKEAKSARGVLLAFDACFETDLSSQKETLENATVIALHKLKVLQDEILMGEFLLKAGFESEVREIFKLYSEILKNALKNKINSNLNKDLNSVIEKFRENYFSDLSDDTRLFYENKYIKEVKKCLNYLKEKLLKKQ